MHATPILTSHLRENLIALLGGATTSRQLNTVINLCIALASELLGRKSGSRKLSLSQGLNEKDLAYDCVADLFQRNEQGCFVQLEAYFSSFDMYSVPDEELLIALRRLVYSRVNQAMFRMYHDIDPAFSRILRNIKLAIETMKQFDEHDRFGEPSIAPVLCPTLEHLPALDADEVQNYLLAHSIGTENIPQMLGKLAVYVRQQECYSRIIPIMTVARILKSVYSLKNEPLLEPPTTETELSGSDTADIVKSACEIVKRESAGKYVGKKKVGEELFNKYFDVIEANVLARIGEQDGGAATYFDLLKESLPALTPEEYKKNHRARIEYLGARAYKLAIIKLRETL